MADVCEISQAAVCIEEGAHVPLDLPGQPAAGSELVANGVSFGKMMGCKRCGLMFWEPLNPHIEFTVIEN